MSTLRQVLLGILAALLSGVLVIGSFSLAMVESGITIAQGSSSEPTRAGTPSPLPPMRTSAPGEPTFTALPTSLATSTPASAGASGGAELGLSTPTLSCPQPPGWIAITVQAGDTLAGLAQVYGIPVGTLMENNCLLVESLPIGSLLFVPGVMPTPSASDTPAAGPTATDQPPVDPGPSCGPFPGWVRYTVRPGDTLSSLSRSTGASISQLQLANCMGSSTVLRAGTSIYVPRLPAIPQASPTMRATAMPSATPAPPTATNPPPATAVPPSRTPLPPTSTRVPTDPPPTPTPAVEPPTLTPLPPTPTTAPPTPTPVTPTTQPPTIVPSTAPPPPTDIPTEAPTPPSEPPAPQEPSDTQSPEGPSETLAPEAPSETQAPASVSP